MNNDARSKLRSMGGIMASSPELMQVAQKFQVGGGVSAGPSPLRTIPTVRQPEMPELGPRNPGYDPKIFRSGTIDPVLAGTRRVAPLSPTQARRNAILERAAMNSPTYGSGAQPFPSSPDMPFEPRVPMGIEGGKNEQRFVTREPQSLAKMREGDFPSILTQEMEEPTVDDLLDITALGGINMGVFNRSLGRDREIPRTDTPTPNESPVASEETPNPEEELNPEETVMAQPLVPTKLDQSVIDKMLDLSRSDPNIPFGTETPSPGGGEDTPGPQTKRDLRSRYKEKLELFKEIYGTDDKDEAQDRAMSLAMIGLAIAAGQSPNALTNIAQGTMVGLQAMGDRREAGRERERGMKTLALQTAIDQMSGEAQADAAAARMEQEQANKLELEREKARLSGGGSGGGGGFKYEPPPLVAETFYKTKNDLATAAREDPSIVPEQYGENVDGWADLQARRSSKDYLRTLLPQLPEGDRESAMRSGQQLLYPDPSGTGLRIVQNLSDLDFILPDQEFVFLDRSVDPPTYVRQKKVVDPETGRFKAVAVE